MARRRDRSLADVKRIRRELSKRLWKAHVEGRWDEEMRVMHRQTNTAMREAAERLKARGITTFEELLRADAKESAMLRPRKAQPRASAERPRKKVRRRRQA